MNPPNKICPACLGRFILSYWACQNGGKNFWWIHFGVGSCGRQNVIVSKTVVGAIPFITVHWQVKAGTFSRSRIAYMHFDILASSLTMKLLLWYIKWILGHFKIISFKSSNLGQYAKTPVYAAPRIPHTYTVGLKFKKNILILRIGSHALGSSKKNLNSFYSQGELPECSMDKMSRWNFF